MFDKNRPRCNDGKALAKVSQDEVASFAAGMALAQRWRVWDVALKLGDSLKPLGLVIAVSEVLFRLVLTYIFFDMVWVYPEQDCLVLFTCMGGR